MNTFAFLARGLITIYKRAQGKSMCKTLDGSLLQQVRELCFQFDASCRQRVPNLMRVDETSGGM